MHPVLVRVSIGDIPLPRTVSLFCNVRLKGTHYFLKRLVFFFLGYHRALNEEFVFAFGVQRRLLLHRLEHYCADMSRYVAITEQTCAPDTSIVSPGSTRPELGRTQYSWRPRQLRQPEAATVDLTFGAVVLTLKATGRSL